MNEEIKTYLKNLAESYIKTEDGYTVSVIQENPAQAIKESDRIENYPAIEWLYEYSIIANKFGGERQDTETSDLITEFEKLRKYIAEQYAKDTRININDEYVFVNEIKDFLIYTEDKNAVCKITIVYSHIEAY